METVKSFNAELSSLYDVKPPISKAKMTAITKGAIKAVKFYKHVVQSVEKFLQKCRPEYKIPGLYVIDSIVRQSRHQFGADKDVFAPRFSKNINFTFYFIYQCTNEEKSKVIRVLNLWQRNTVFPPEVIQPLFDMADSSHPKYREVASIIGTKGASGSTSDLPKSQMTGSGGATGALETNSSSALNGSVRDSSMGGYDDNSNDGNQNLIMGKLPNLSSTEMSLATRLQHLQHLFGQEPSAAPGATGQQQLAGSQVSQAARAANANPDTGQIRFNKKLLDFDYDDEDDEPADNKARDSQQPQQMAPPTQQQSQQQLQQPASDTLGNLLTNPDILRHLQSLQQQISQPTSASSIMAPNSQGTNGSAGDPAHKDHFHHQQPQHGGYSSVDFSQPPPGFNPLAMGINVPMSMAAMVPHALQGMNYPLQPGSRPPPPPPQQQQSMMHQDRRDQDHHHHHSMIYSNNGDAGDVEQPLRNRGGDRRRSRSRSRSNSRNRMAGSRSAGGSRQRGKSRSRSRDKSGAAGVNSGTNSDRDRRQRNRASRSRSRSRSTGRSRNRRRSRSRDREERERKRQETEKERERKRKGLPPIKKEHLIVCSTTLWVGHLSKLVQQEELSDTFGQYGEIISIDLIPPRGCAFVCMHRRQDAFRALTKLAGHKLQGKAITLAWAPGKGVKAKEWKDYWEVEQGVSYIPWSKLSTQTDWTALEEGGSYDEETLPAWARPNSMENQSEVQMLVPGFIPIPEAGSTIGPGPPTPETASDGSAHPPCPSMVSAGGGGAGSMPTQLPHNLPTYAMGPLGLAGIGMPALPVGMAAGLRLPPPGMMVGPPPPHGNGMPNLLGQSILAGLANGNVGAMAAASSLALSAMAGQAGNPPGFFGVFPPAQPAQQHHAAHNSEDDMELEDAEDEDRKDPLGQRLDHAANVAWRDDGEADKDRKHFHADSGMPLQQENKLPSLLDRLRSLANNDGAGPTLNRPPNMFDMEMNGPSVQDQDRLRIEGSGSLMVRSDLGIGSMEPGNGGSRFALSPAARGVSGVVAGRANVDPFAAPPLRMAPDDSFPPRHMIAQDDSFSARHMIPQSPHGVPAFGGGGGAPGAFGAMRGAMSNSTSPAPRVAIAGARGMMFPDGRGGPPPPGCFRPGAGDMAMDGERVSRWAPAGLDDESCRWNRDPTGVVVDDRFRPDLNHGGPGEWPMDRDFGDRDRHWRDRAAGPGGDGMDRDGRRGGPVGAGPARDWGGRRRHDRDRGTGMASRDRFGRDRERNAVPGGDRRGRSGDRDGGRRNRWSNVNSGRSSPPPPLPPSAPAQDQNISESSDPTMEEPAPIKNESSCAPESSSPPPPPAGDDQYFSCKMEPAPPPPAAPSTPPVPPPSSIVKTEETTPQDPHRSHEDPATSE